MTALAFAIVDLRFVIPEPAALLLKESIWAGDNRKSEMRNRCYG